jgi:hypothetical protein
MGKQHLVQMFLPFCAIFDFNFFLTFGFGKVGILDWEGILKSCCEGAVNKNY